MLVGFILNIVFNLTLRFLYQLENKKRDRELEGKREEEIEALREESRVQGFENVTDKQNVSYLGPNTRPLLTNFTGILPIRAVRMRQCPRLDKWSSGNDIISIPSKWKL